MLLLNEYGMILYPARHHLPGGADSILRELEEAVGVVEVNGDCFTRCKGKG